MKYKTIIEVMMYSGMCSHDPRCEMTDQEKEILFEKLRKLHKPGVQNRFGTGVLGADSFGVIQGVEVWSWDDFKLEMDQSYWEALEFPHIDVTPGLVSLYKWENNQYKTYLYEDTENVHSFLSELVAPAIVEHYTGSQWATQQWIWDPSLFISSK